MTIAVGSGTHSILCAAAVMKEIVYQGMNPEYYVGYQSVSDCKPEDLLENFMKHPEHLSSGRVLHPH